MKNEEISQTTDGDVVIRKSARKKRRAQSSGKTDRALDYSIKLCAALSLVTTAALVINLFI